MKRKRRRRRGVKRFFCSFAQLWAAAKQCNTFHHCLLIVNSPSAYRHAYYNVHLRISQVCKTATTAKKSRCCLQCRLDINLNGDVYTCNLYGCNNNATGLMTWIKRTGKSERRTTKKKQINTRARSENEKEIDRERQKKAQQTNRYCQLI